MPSEPAPRRKVDAGADPPPAPQDRHAADPGPGPPERGPLAGVAILFVDDDPDIREAVEALLSAAGARVVTAGSVQRALLALDADRPDILISDIGMPGRDGWEFIREVRRRPPESGGRVRALALTAFARSEDLRRSIDEGYDHHAVKPIAPDALVAIVRALAARDPG